MAQARGLRPRTWQGTLEVTFQIAWTAGAIAAAVGDVEPLYVGLAEDYRGARTFYEKRGFRLDGARRDEQFLGETLTEVRYVRP